MSECLVSLITSIYSASFFRPTSLRPVRFLTGVIAAVLLVAETVCYGPSVEAVFLVFLRCFSGVDLCVMSLCL